MMNPDKKMSASLPLVRRALETYVKPLWPEISVALLLMLITAAMTGVVAKLMEPIIDKVFSAKDAAMLWPVALSVLGVFLVRGFATYGHTVIMSKVGQRIISNMQKDLFGHLVYADLAYFHSQQSGQLQSRFLADMTMVRTALIESLAGIGKNTFTLIILVGVMVWQDWKLSIVALFVFPIIGVVVARLGRKLRKVSTSMQEETGDLTGLLGQAFQGTRHIRAYGMEEFEKARIGRIIENIFNLMYKSYKTSAIGTPLAEILSGLAVVTLIVYGGYQVLAGVTTAGKLFSFITAFLLAFEPMKRLTRLNNIMQMGLAAVERYFDLLDMKPAIASKPDAVTLATDKAEVVFDHVAFKYREGAEALHGVSFVAPAGKTIALVGPSGAGKSTILNLIPRFYDVTEGAICIDGHDIRDLTLQSLRRSMALVSQEVSMFSDTVRENIMYGCGDVTEEQLIEASKAAVAHDFIMELPNGYDTHVGENGVTLSGGQRQRIAIARAMLRNAPILLLDEATSALDTQSERMVQTALDRLQKGRTTIIVAHRLSTIMNADIIYVMKDGHIVEEGKHEDLLGKDGVYAGLYGTMMRESA
ncbi:MAG: ABC transporter transmembrane domain-containing protein [Alphaproteobacteria bacterium]|nr:ABC transporter transmembrane domain-containing protein [Alphaproteobacteria bacterium]